MICVLIIYFFFERFSASSLAALANLGPHNKLSVNAFLNTAVTVASLSDCVIFLALGAGVVLSIAKTFLVVTCTAAALAASVESPFLTLLELLDLGNITNFCLCF